LIKPETRRVFVNVAQATAMPPPAWQPDSRAPVLLAKGQEIKLEENLHRIALHFERPSHGQTRKAKQSHKAGFFRRTK
jgi:hypothetical protein